jgi:hypothetical protein
MKKYQEKKLCIRQIREPNMHISGKLALDETT